ncbi:MAG: lytic transglycosylase domain-containing protein [Spirochaetales bacterium]|nr:lytic transglycosylase domain-containing protein [Spirochaetales bacterium]
MQVQKFLYPRSKYKFFLPILFLFIFVLISCETNKIWNIPIEKIRHSIEESDYSLFEKIDFKDEKIKIEDILRLGDEAPYFMSLIFDKIYRENTSEKLLETGWSKSYGWYEPCGLLLLEKLVKKDEFSTIKKHFSGQLHRFKDPGNLKKAKYKMIEALYWEKRDKEVLAAINDYVAEYTEEEKNLELKLFQAVSLCRLEKDNWPDLFKDLFFKDSVSTVHKRAYDFLLLDENRVKKFSEPLMDFFTARYYLITGKQPEAIPLFEKSLTDLDLSAYTMSPILYQLYTAYTGTAQYRAGAQFFSRLSQKLNAGDKTYAMEITARFYRLLKNYSLGINIMEGFLDDIRDTEQMERVVWFILDMSRESSPELFRKKLIHYMNRIKDREYFEDLFVTEINSLVSQRQWKKLWDLYILIRPVSSEKIVNQLTYILVRLVDKGFLKLGEKEKTAIKQSLLTDIAQKCTHDYYVLLSALYLNQEHCLLKLAKTSGDTVKATSPPSPPFLDDSVKKIFFYMEYGLYTEACDLAMETRDTIPREILLVMAKRFNAAGHYRESIRLLSSLLWRVDDLSLTLEELKFIFPLVYSDEIKSSTETENIPFFPFVALIREESLFDKDIVSRAGAVGLTQLIEVTAEESARRLGITNPDLTDPGTNIAMGADYFNRLYTRVDLSKSLMAYNAGLSNVRRWQRAFKDLPGDLFTEAISYSETRAYTKKIIITTILYYFIYGSKEPEDVLKMFYPDY